MSESIYDNMVNKIEAGVEKPNRVQANQIKKGRKPLKMPKNYDFSVRNVDWKEYKNDFILRTDAIWERSKMKDIFYGNYKANFMYDKISDRYMIANLRMMPMPTNEPEHLEDWRPFMGYTDIEGCVW